MSAIVKINRFRGHWRALGVLSHPWNPMEDLPFSPQGIPDALWVEGHLCTKVHPYFWPPYEAYMYQWHGYGTTPQEAARWRHSYTDQDGYFRLPEERLAMGAPLDGREFHDDPRWRTENLLKGEENEPTTRLED